MRLFELIQPPDSYSDAWKRAEAKGLPMDRESRLARAAAMGFDIGTVYYKGMYPYDWNKETENDPGPEITKIHRSTEFPAFSGNEPGIRIAGFFTPDPKVANYFSMVSGSAGYPVFLKFTNVFTMDARDRTAGSLQFGDSGGAFREVVRSGKYDIIKINNTKDEGDLVIVLDPKNIRSIHAAFDPDNDGSPDLLEVSMQSGAESRIDSRNYNENLFVYLDEINSESMRERMGRERLVSTDGDFQITEGEFGGWRILKRNEAGEIIAVFQGITLEDGEKLISNVYVRPDYRRKGIGAELKQQAEDIFGPGLVVNNSFSGSGARLFGIEQ